MKFPRMVRTELVISMTLAETFLLLLFVVWYSLAKDVTPEPPSPLELEVRDLENKVHKLEGEIVEEKKKNEDFKARVNFWREHYNMDIPGTEAEVTKFVKQYLTEGGRGYPMNFWREHYNMDIPGTEKEVAKFVKQYLAEGGRGHPKCQENNVLLQVAVIKGQTQMEFVTGSPPLVQFLTSNGVKKLGVGDIVTDASQIEAILRAVSNFYKARSAGKQDCRFDYRLLYGTNDDYHDGRELYERYFYPARITKSGE